MIPKDFLYTKDHEWVKIDGDTAKVGITDFAQSELGEVVFIDLPPVGKEFKLGEVFCVIESTKAASDVYAPVSGKISEVNSVLTSNPELVNSEPYNNWIVKFADVDAAEISSLLDPGKYSELIGG